MTRWRKRFSIKKRIESEKGENSKQKDSNEKNTSTKERQKEGP